MKWLIFLPVFLSACTVGPDFVRPKAPSVKQYAHGTEVTATIKADRHSQRFDSGAPVPARWWALFSAPQLDPIVTSALDSNPTLQAALANLRQSQYNLRAGYGAFYPSINAGADASREKSNPSSFGINAPTTEFNLFTLSSSVSYALDVFGGQRRSVEALGAQVDFQRYTVLATYLALTGNIVNTIIARAAYQGELEATQQLIAQQKEQVRITATQFRSGTVSYAVLLAIQSQLSATEASLPPLRQKLVQSEDLMASLSGKAPAEWNAPAIALGELTLPGNLPKSLPSDLARQRPDVLEAEAELHVASAQLGVATAALYPSFTLSGSFGVTNVSAGNLFKAGSDFWTFGAGILAPLFHGGTLRAQKKAALEAFQSALALYRQAVLSGISQVADTLRALENDAELVQAQLLSVNEAGQSMALIQANYRSGTVTYLQLLTANSQYIQARIGYLQGVAQRLQDTVALYLALGGGWWNADRTLRRSLSAPKAASD